MSVKDDFISLGEELASDKNKAFDLWTHLPSYQDAVRGHGDYATEHCPSVSDVMTEAAMFIAHGLNPTAEQVKQAGEFYLCNCGEDHSKQEGSAE